MHFPNPSWLVAQNKTRQLITTSIVGLLSLSGLALVHEFDSSGGLVTHGAILVISCDALVTFMLLKIIDIVSPARSKAAIRTGITGVLAGEGVAS